MTKTTVPSCASQQHSSAGTPPPGGATAIFVLIPGTLTMAAEPSGMAVRRAAEDDAGRPAASAAVGTSRAAWLLWTLLGIVV
jgi:hypothetical protein